MLRDKCTYLENQSRRNNIRIDGIPEETDETWDQMESKVKEAIEQKLQIQSVSIERAHRIGKRRSDGKPRTVICKLYDWKLKERLLKDARRKKPDGLFIKEDFADQTMKTRKALMPRLLEAKKQGKIAYFIVDKLVIKERAYVR